MAKKHKIGVHVNGAQRNNYGVAAPHLASVVSFDPGAFDEIPEQAIKIFRTHEVHDHKDAPGDFDRLKDHELIDAADHWWAILKARYAPIKEKYENVYFQVTNEINNARVIIYLRQMCRLAEKDGFKLALFGDAGGSPHLEDWVKEWLPFLKEVQGGGHIYSRHAYSGVTTESTYLTKPDGSPSDSNTARPFIEADYMLKQGIYMPIVITELGWLAGHNALPSGWEGDLLRYNKLMMTHDNIVGSCLWNAGYWDQGINKKNVLSGKPLKDLGQMLSSMTPVFFDPNAVTTQEPTNPEPADEPEPEPDKYDSFESMIEALAIKNQVIRYNGNAALEKEILSAGFRQITNEFEAEWEGVRWVMQSAQSLETAELRTYMVQHGRWDEVEYHTHSVGADGKPWERQVPVVVEQPPR